jgi:hypothetical protein
VPHDDHEVRAEEDHHLAGVDDLAGGRQLLVLDEDDGLQHQEERVAVPLQLGPLMGLHRVLDGQRVQAEDPGDLRQVHRLRLVQPYPREAAALAGLVQRLLRRQRGRPAAVLVHRAVHHDVRGAAALLRYGAGALQGVPPGRAPPLAARTPPVRRTGVLLHRAFSKTAIAALCPGTPLTPPPRTAPAPHT